MRTEPKTWLDAICFKPTYIRAKIAEAQEDESILWVDADARFVASPRESLANLERELFLWGAHVHRWSPSHPWETLTGTLFFRKTREVLWMLERWEMATDEWRKVNRDTPEQHALAQAAGDAGIATDRQEIGPEMCWIDGAEFGTLHPGKAPVIWHGQASRRYRR